jgi:hypothetical protein
VSGDVQRTLEWLFGPDDVFEARVLKTKQRTRSGYFQRNGAALRAIADEDASGAAAVYVTLNPVNPALHARCRNRVQGFAETVTSDREILRRRNLLIDADPVRPSGISSTDEEHDLACQRVHAIVGFLETFGVERLLIADSGNGWHLIVPIDLPNDDASRILCENVLKALDHHFSDARVKIDVSVANASRLVKCYGTMVRKGDSTPDRPHRRSAIANAGVRSNVSRETLAAIAALAPCESPHARKGAGAAFDVAGFLARHAIQVRRKGAWQGAQRWILSKCVFDPSHSGSSAAIVQHPNGAVSYRCLHDSCCGKTWADAREQFEPGYRERRERPPIAAAGRDQRASEAAPKSTVRLKLTSLADVPITRVEWLEPGRVPRGKFIAIEGPGDVGKTTTNLTMIARHSRGERFYPCDEPDAQRYPIRPNKILVIAKEDDQATLKARLRLADADESRFAFIDGRELVNEAGEVEQADGSVYLPRDIVLLERAITEFGATECYIDALHSHVTVDGDAKNPTDVRASYQQIIDLLTRTGVTLYGNRHWGKGPGSAHDRGLGSSEIGHLARAVLTFAVHPNDPELRVVTQTKRNLARTMPTVIYRIEEIEAHDDDGKPWTVPKVVIVGTDAGVRPDDVAFAIPVGGDERTEVEQCSLAILAVFNGVDTVTAAHVKNATDDFADKTRERARRELTRANVLKRGYTGKPKEPGEVVYSVDRSALAVFAKKLGDRHSQEWGTRQKGGDHHEPDEPPRDDGQSDADNLFRYAEQRIPSAEPCSFFKGRFTGRPGERCERCAMTWADHHR